MFLKLIILLLLPSSVLAQVLSKEQCSQTDIRNTNPKIRASKELKDHFTKPRDQDSIGWCYAFAAADLLSAEVGAPVSAFHTSVLYNNKLDGKLFSKMLHSKNAFNEVMEGGYPDKAMAYLVENGRVCKEKDLPFDENYGQETYSFIAHLEYLKKQYKNKQIDYDKFCSEANQTLVGKELRSQTDDVLRFLTNENLSLALLKIIQEHCKNKMIPVPKLTVNSKSVPNSNKDAGKLFQDLNTILDRGTPFEIAYNIKHIVHKGQRGYHSSIVTGRRWNKNQCQYKVRNSWGKSCASYSNVVECDKDTGSFWVSDEVLKKMTSKVRYFSK